MKISTVTTWPNKRLNPSSLLRWTNKPVFLSALIAILLVGCGTDDQSPQDVSATSVDKTSSKQSSATSEVSAISRIRADKGYSASGEVRFHQEPNGVRISGEVTGLSPGQHGFHIHEFGDCSAPDGKSAGGHFAPNGNPHGSPQDNVNKRHAGDLGNITADKNGRASIGVLNAELTINKGPKAVIGKSVIVHAGSDDLSSQPSGDAGARVGCGVIEEAQSSQ